MDMDGAIGEGNVFLEYFRDVPDPRQAGKVVCPLDEILLPCLLAVLAGAETFTDIARFGTKKRALLRRIRPFRTGTPAHDHLGDIFATLGAEKFQHCFVAWVSAQTGASADAIVISAALATMAMPLSTIAPSMLNSRSLANSSIGNPPAGTTTSTPCPLFDQRPPLAAELFLDLVAGGFVLERADDERRDFGVDGANSDDPLAEAVPGDLLVGAR